MFVGLMSDRGRGSIGSYVGNVVYSIVAMGMLATVRPRLLRMGVGACKASGCQVGLQHRHALGSY